MTHLSDFPGVFFLLADQVKPRQASNTTKLDQDQKIEHF